MEREKILEKSKLERVVIILSNGFSYTGKLIKVEINTSDLKDYKNNIITLSNSEIIGIEGGL